MISYRRDVQHCVFAYLSTVVLPSHATIQNCDSRSERFSHNPGGPYLYLLRGSAYRSLVSCSKLAKRYDNLSNFSLAAT